MLKLEKRYIDIFLTFFVVFLSIISLSIFLDNIYYIKTLTASYKSILSTVTFFIILSQLLTTIVFINNGKSVSKRLSFFLIIVVLFASLIISYIIKSGLIYKIDSVEDLRLYISSFGTYSIVLYILVQFLQVVAIPIPSFITIGAGVLLFGPLKTAIFSIIGILLGSYFAFFVGRKLGKKAIIWLIGEKSLNKGLNFVYGKDNILLSLMFLFPFFPDDILCFVSGLTKMSAKFFAIMILFVRTATVFCACYSINNSLIPYNTWWGMLLWAIYFVFIIIAFILVYKYGERIEDKLKKKIFKSL